MEYSDFFSHTWSKTNVLKLTISIFARARYSLRIDWTKLHFAQVERGYLYMRVFGWTNIMTTLLKKNTHVRRDNRVLLKYISPRYEANAKVCLIVESNMCMQMSLMTHPRDLLLGINLVIFRGRSEVQIALAISSTDTHSVNLVLAGSTVQTEETKRNGMRDLLLIERKKTVT